MKFMKLGIMILMLMISIHVEAHTIKIINKTNKFLDVLAGYVSSDTQAEMAGDVILTLGVVTSKYADKINDNIEDLKRWDYAGFDKGWGFGWILSFKKQVPMKSKIAEFDVGTGCVRAIKVRESGTSNYVVRAIKASENQCASHSFEAYLDKKNKLQIRKKIA